MFTQIIGQYHNDVWTLLHLWANFDGQCNGQNYNKHAYKRTNDEDVSDLIGSVNDFWFVLYLIISLFLHVTENMVIRWQLR